MKKLTLWELLCHALIVLAGMFTVFFFIDRVNPAMGFLDSAMSKWLLLGFCLTAIGCGGYSVYMIRRIRAKRRKAALEEEKSE